MRHVQSLPTTSLRFRPAIAQSKTRNVLVSCNAAGEINHWHITSGTRVFFFSRPIQNGYILGSSLVGRYTERPVDLRACLGGRHNETNPLGYTSMRTNMNSRTTKRHGHRPGGRVERRAGDLSEGDTQYDGTMISWVCSRNYCVCVSGVEKPCQESSASLPSPRDLRPPETDIRASRVLANNVLVRFGARQGSV